MVAILRMVISQVLPMLTGPQWVLRARARMPLMVSST
jgi:hypothetical protein